MRVINNGDHTLMTVAEYRALFGERGPRVHHCGSDNSVDGWAERLGGWTSTSWSPLRTEQPDYVVAVRGAYTQCPPSDTVDHPAHYTFGKLEAIEVIEDWQLGYNLGNALKYIARAGKKDPAKTVEDLKKAVWYLNREIGRRE